VDERMLVPDYVAAWPPGIDVRMTRIGCENRLKAAVWALLYVKLQFVHSLQIERNTSFTAVDFKSQMVLMARGGSRSFNRADRSIFKLEQAYRRVIDINGSLCGAVWQGPLGYESLKQSCNFRDLADQES